jgi:transposase
MRTIGIDLAVSQAHKAVVVDEGGRFVSPVLHCRTEPSSLQRLLAEAQRGNSDGQLQAVMEPTGMAWFPVAVWLIRQGVTVYLVNSQQVADLRRYYKKHAKSDRIDCRVLAKLPLVDAEQLHPLALSGAVGQACQRGCKEFDRLGKLVTASQNRLIALDRFAWPGLEEAVFSDLFSPQAGWFRQHWYHPGHVVQAGAEVIRAAWLESGLDPDDPGAWIGYLVRLAEQVLELYGSQAAYLDYDLLQGEVCREQALLDFLRSMQHQVQLKVVHRLYRKLHPSRHLETLMGVGQDGAAVYASFIGQPQRFDSLRSHRGWSGMVPNSKQSAASQLSGLKITQAGPRLIKKFAYLDAEVARRYDPQIAAIYYDQMVNKGKHHCQAICACATHLLDRILVVLSQDRPYQLRDVDGIPLSKLEARQIIAERYLVPEAVRQPNNKRRRRERTEQQVENKTMRESGALVSGVALGSPSKPGKRQA